MKWNIMSNSTLILNSDQLNPVTDSRTTLCDKPSCLLIVYSFVYCKFKLISTDFAADMTKALVCFMNSKVRGISYVQKLYGDPDEYAYKFENDTFARKLPIQMKWIYFMAYGYLHSMSINYETQRVYFCNNFFQRLGHGLFIYDNETHSYYFDTVPDTNQVTATYTQHRTDI